MSSQFQGKVIAVTGAASGIGRATAKLLASQSAFLSLADMDIDGLSRIAQEIAPFYGISSDGHPPPVFTTVLDVRSGQDTAAWIDATLKHFTGMPLHGAVNAAGVAGATALTDAGKLKSVPMEDFDFVMDVNCKGVLNCLRAQLPMTKEGEGGRGGGSIVNISSLASIMATPNQAAYSASKHAVLGLTRSAAKEEGPRGIRVNSISPGMIETPLLKEVQQRNPEFASTPGMAALGRRGDPEEIAQVAAFLLSDQSSFISGANIVADGGWRC